MRVLLVNKFWRPLGGVEQHALFLKETLEERGHEVVPFAMSDPENWPTPYDEYFVSAVDFRAPGLRERLRAMGRALIGRETVSRLRALLTTEQFDVAHVLHGYHQLGPAFPRELRRRGIPVVLSLHDYKPACPSYLLYSEHSNSMCTLCLDRRFGFLWGPTSRRCWNSSRMAGVALTAEAIAARAWGTYRVAGSVIVLNALQRRAARRAGVSDARIVTVPHFVEMTDQASSSERDDGHQVDGSVLYVGRLSPEKGVDVLIRACAAIGAPLRVIGDGRIRTELEALSRDVGSRVVFRGTLPPNEVEIEMHAASVLAVPSVCAEVSPVVVVEACRASLPVVASAVGGLPSLVGDGRGVLVSPGDPDRLAEELAAVLNDAAGRDRIANCAAQHARRCLTKDRWLAGIGHAYSLAGAPIP